MQQSGEISRILDRITDESANVSPTKKVITRVRSNKKSTRPQKVQISIPKSSKPAEENLVDKQWQIIDTWLISLMESAGAGSFEEAIRAVEQICKKRENLEIVHEKLTKRLNDLGESICGKLNPPIDLVLVLKVTQQCERVSILLSSIFSVFERSYLAPATVKGIFMETVAKYIKENEAVVEAICKAVASGVSVQRDLPSSGVSEELKQIADFLTQVDLLTEFTRAVVSETGNYYGEHRFNYENPAMFLLEARSRVEKEEAIMSCFAKDVVSPVLDEARRCIYGDILIQKMGMCLPLLIDNCDIEMTKLLVCMVFDAKSEPLVDVLARTWIRDMDRRANKWLEIKGTEMIDTIFKIHEPLHACSGLFSANARRQIFRGVQNAVNRDQNKIAFMLASYCHNNITRGDFETKTNQVMLLLRELETMDIFMKYYKQFLALRLPGYTTSVPSIETYLLEKIAANCGEEATRVMEDLLTCHSESLVNTHEFQPRNTIPTNIFVMRADSWPTTPSVVLKLPPFVLDLHVDFSTFYSEKQPRRKIEWKPVLDQVSFKLNNCQITGSVVYYLYLESVIDSMPFEQSGMTEEHEENILEVLVQHDIVRVVDGIATVNEAIPHDEINLPIPSVLAPVELPSDAHEDIAWSRKMKVEAALVLILKKAKVLPVEDLFNEALSNATFHMTRDDLSAALESCIEKEYLSRDGELIKYE